MPSRFRTIEVSDPRFSHDGLHHITVKSPNLRGRGDITVYVPEHPAGPLPLVVLLHGVYGSHWAWAMKGGVHRTAARLIASGQIRPVALAMPSDGLFGDGSGYLPHSGFDFARWILDDVPAAVGEAFPPVHSAGAGLFLAGLSMGGFGALRLGATHPERFMGFSGLSSITDLSQMADFVEEPLATFTSGAKHGSVLLALLENRDRLSPFRFDCGRDDELLPANRALHQQLDAHQIPHTYQEFEGGHEWAYWEKNIVHTLLFFDGLREAAR